MISALERSDYEILIAYEIGGTPSGVLPFELGGVGNVLAVKEWGNVPKPNSTTLFFF